MIWRLRPDLALLLVLPVLLVLLPAAAQAATQVATQVATTVIRYPRPESGADERSRYPLRLLELALARAGQDYRVELSPVRMQQGRALLLLEDSDGIDVLSTMTSAEREARLQPVRIPIDKGLLGWRLLLVEQERLGALRQVRSLAQLRRYAAGQGSDWPDTAILRANGLPVYGTSSYESLFSMLESGRIAYFPRSVTEVWAEADQHPTLAVVPGIVLRYPAAMYFFVRKDDVRLAAALTAGLEAMIADGSFERLFQEHFGDTIRRAGLHERRILDLTNPLMPNNMPLARKALWYRE